MIARATYYLRRGFSFRSATTKKKKSSRSSRENRRWRYGGGQKRKEVDDDYDDGGAFGMQDGGGGSARCAGRRARRGRWRGEGGMNKDEVYGSGGEEEGDGGVRRTKRAARSTG